MKIIFLVLSCSILYCNEIDLDELNKSKDQSEYKYSYINNCSSVIVNSIQTKNKESIINLLNQNFFIDIVFDGFQYEKNAKSINIVLEILFEKKGVNNFIGRAEDYPSYYDLMLNKNSKVLISEKNGAINIENDQNEFILYTIIFSNFKGECKILGFNLD
ncbi:MAG: hypothetical protein MH321_18640 [Leptospiraceae bacterium]|nr:hypothetical protein [Leptospiraceae bacterium]